ncbi:hypothetical protein [Micromonospora rifamycinica]|uniref:Uncharacterized protein n=1 Tax=Micromonospora rifamycinica TaxID=291594 RepID=A0A109IF48_9ACTN|nr:hypothetical protein [Micromonospora rifamycinica]KWV29411.1 hypothetical protein AWV63_28780 [Micromonospora rifamycinica]SCG80975.1 hypothetical protein GA0070623_5345 [Micromonospora rifamycinica]
MSDREFYCDTCESVQLFEVPPCPDGHGTDCPELACTGCGAAVLIATFAFQPTRLADRRRRSPAGRHAA